MKFSWYFGRSALSLSRFHALLLIFVWAGCGDGGEMVGPDPDPTPSLEPTLINVQGAVFTPSCAISGCHNSLSRASLLDLSSGESFGSLVGQPSVERPAIRRVEAGFPERSYLILKIRGDDSILGGRMPLGRGPLSEDRIQLVEEWIQRGARDD